MVAVFALAICGAPLYVVCAVVWSEYWIMRRERLAAIANRKDSTDDV